MNSNFRNSFLGFDEQFFSDEPSNLLQKPENMEENFFDTDKNIDLDEFLQNLNLPSPPLSGNNLFEQDFDDDVAKNFNLYRDVMLSDVAVNRQISRDSLTGGNQNGSKSESITDGSNKGYKNETKSDDEDDDDDDDSVSSAEQLNILTKTAHDYERSAHQTSANPSFSLNAEQMNKFRNYFSSKPSSMTVRNTNNANQFGVEREVVVGRRPKQSVSPMSSTDKSRGAMYARQYRQKNKEFVDKMQHELDQLTEENKDLRERVTEMSDTMSNLNQEVAYLRNVLANQSQLSSLLKGVTNTPGLKFRFPITQVENTSSDIVDQQQRYPTRKRKQQDLEEVAPVKKSKQIGRKMESMPGVCLHVNGDNVSLEFCARCSNEARCDS